MNESSILLVGCGKMGGAILSGWIDSSISPDRISVVSPVVFDDYIFEGVSYYDSYDKLTDNYNPDVILIAVKPQLLPSMLADYSSFANNGSIFVSIVAGKSIKFFKDILGKDSKIVRSMPNLPALESCGVTVLYADETINEDNRNLCTNLLSSIGKVHWIGEEEKMNDVTAVSGSGPAYLLYFIECFVESAIDIGIDKELATSLVIETIYGTAQLVSNSGISASELRRDVTSPGGTTEAALRIFMDDEKFKKIISNAVASAKKRAIELDS